MRPSEKKQEKAWSLSSVPGAHGGSEHEGMGHDLRTVACWDSHPFSSGGHGFSPASKLSFAHSPRDQMQT